MRLIPGEVEGDERRPGGSYAASLLLLNQMHEPLECECLQMQGHVSDPRHALQHKELHEKVAHGETCKTFTTWGSERIRSFSDCLECC